MHIGQNVQFQLREVDISRQETRQLLLASKERSSTAPIFGLLIACLGRGESLFGVQNGDVDIAPLGGSTHTYTACWGLLSPLSTYFNNSGL